jgi:hypothetical protein
MRLVIFLCPLAVSLIAGRRFILWGVATNLLLFVSLLVRVYLLREGWIFFKKDFLGLAVFCAFGLLSGAAAGALVQRHRQRRTAAA